MKRSVIIFSMLYLLTACQIGLAMESKESEKNPSSHCSEQSDKSFEEWTHEISETYLALLVQGRETWGKIVDVKNTNEEYVVKYFIANSEAKGWYRDRTITYENGIIEHIENMPLNEIWVRYDYKDLPHFTVAWHPSAPIEYDGPLHFGKYYFDRCMLFAPLFYKINADEMETTIRSRLITGVPPICLTPGKTVSVSLDASSSSSSSSVSSSSSTATTSSNTAIVQNTTATLVRDEETKEASNTRSRRNWLSALVGMFMGGGSQ